MNRQSLPRRDVAMGVPVPCNHCGGMVLWLRTDAKKLVPVDARPDPERGNIRRAGSHATFLSNSAAVAQRAAGVPLRTHHAATCPYADRWRSGSKTRAENAQNAGDVAEPTEAGLW